MLESGHGAETIRRLIMRCHALAAVLYSLLCCISSAGAAENDSVKERLVIAHWGKERILLYLPLYVAMEEGLFAKRGLDVHLKYSGNDDQVFASVMSGDADLGIGDPVFAAIARQRGFPGKVVAGVVVKLGLSGYTDRTDIPEILKVEQLAGLRIATFPAPSTTYTLLKDIIGKHQPTLSETKIVQMAIGAQAAALGAKSVDIATDLEPAVSIAESQGNRVVFSLDKFTPSLAITGLTTTEDVISKKEVSIGKAVSALDEALRLLNESPEIGIRVTQKIFPQLSKQVAVNAVTRLLKLSAFPKSAKISDENWQRTLQLRIASGDLKQLEKIEGTLESRFTDAAEKL